MSETCCKRLAGNTGRKNDAKNRHLGTIAQLCPAVSSHVRHVSTIRKNLLSSNMSSIRPHNMVNFGPLAAEFCWRVWGTPANFNGFRVLAALLQRRRSAEANQTLHDVWPCPALLHYIYISGGSCTPDRILPGAKFTLHPSVAFSYIASVTARHSSSGRQSNFTAWYKEWNYRTSVEGATYIRQGGHHVGHRPTF